jgi:hypothetical protein
MEILKVDEDGFEYEVEGTFELDGEEVIILIYPQEDGQVLVVAMAVDCDFEMAWRSYPSDYSMTDAAMKFISDHEIYWVE